MLFNGFTRLPLNNRRPALLLPSANVEDDQAVPSSPMPPKAPVVLLR